MKNLERLFAEKLLKIKAIKLQPANPFTWASGWKSPELGSTTSLPVCYDLACPNCYSAYNISRALQLKEGGYAACVSCGRTYNLNNQGQISIGEEGVSLFRYRITYSGNTMVINNR